MKQPGHNEVTLALREDFLAHEITIGIIVTQAHLSVHMRALDCLDLLHRHVLWGLCAGYAGVATWWRFVPSAK